MKMKNALKKIIYTGFALIVAFLSVFSFYVPASASDTYRLQVVVKSGNISNGYSAFVRLDIYDADTDTHLGGSTDYTPYSQTNMYLNFNLDISGSYYCTLYYQYSLYPSEIYYIPILYNNSPLSTDSNNPTVFPLENISCTGTRSTILSSTDYQYFRFDVATPTPTPTPDPTPTPTPTPAPATPTPDANAVAFFDKLGNDAQNGFGAILTSWTAANSHFYTSILFIALPVFLGIVGLIASFFFGGSDD